MSSEDVGKALMKGGASMMGCGCLIMILGPFFLLVLLLIASLVGSIL